MAVLVRAFLTVLFSITLIELFIGGGGRVVEFGPLTLRMVLFGSNLALVSVLWISRGKIQVYIVVLSFTVLTLLILYALIGRINGASMALIIEDIKPLSYLFSILFFGYFIDSKERVQLVVSLIKLSSLLMALTYVGLQIFFYLGQLQFHPFYNYVNTQISATDFIFRGTQGLFFYKGFMYMVVGLIFWIHSTDSKLKALAIFIIMIAMIFSGTRGFILMFGFVYALFYGVPLLLRLNIKTLILASVLVFGSVFFFGSQDIGDKEVSDSARVQQVVQVVQDIDPVSFFVGHGFGNGVPVRPIHMEIGYLEVFHKQGIIGLCFWGLFFIVLYNAYVRKRNFPAIRKAFFLSLLFMALLSLTNPFFNNPIGISLFMISLASFSVLNKFDNNRGGVDLTDEPNT